MIQGKRDAQDKDNSQKDDPKNEFNLDAFIEKLPPGFRDAYNDRTEIQNYNSPGSYFNGMSEANSLISIVKKAIELGLPQEKVKGFIEGSDIFSHLSEHQKKEVVERFVSSELYFPGPIHVVESLNTKWRYRTVPEIGTDRENIYYFNGQIHERAEELIKAESHKEYLKQWREMLQSATEDEEKSLMARLTNALHSGPSSNQINEVLSMIRRTTFTTEEMNPPSHIPFKNGLLNLKTRQLKAFTSDFFYTYQVDANLLTDRWISLKDIPLFAGLLNTAFYETDVPMILSYFAYSFFPDLPAHRVLFILGRERIGKGTSVRVLQGLMPKGSGSISLARILTSDRFQFSGIEGKNLLIDSETKRKFKRGTVFDWSAFCNLFGKDNLNHEPKGKEAHDYVSKAKGIFLGNLPFLSVDSPPAISRILIVETRNERPARDIKNLDQKILEAERDEIATLLMQILFNLMDRDFNFPGQLTDEATTEILEQLADPVAQFIEECTEYDKDSSVLVQDAYQRFVEWLKSKGIPTIARQTFVKTFGRTYKKRRVGTHGKGGYAFDGCLLYEDDLEVNTRNSKQVRTLGNSQETLKINLSGERYRRFQHESCNLHVMREKKDHEYNKKISAQKLEPSLKSSRALENKAPGETESGSNLYQESDPILEDKSNESQPDPSKSSVQSEKSANPKYYKYRVLKDFTIYGRVYRSGTEFILMDYLEAGLENGNLELMEGGT